MFFLEFHLLSTKYWPCYWSVELCEILRCKTRNIFVSAFPLRLRNHSLTWEPLQLCTFLFTRNRNSPNWTLLKLRAIILCHMLEYYLLESYLFDEQFKMNGMSGWVIAGDDNSFEHMLAGIMISLWDYVFFNLIFFGNGSSIQLSPNPSPTVLTVKHMFVDDSISDVLGRCCP